jgi:DNA modification methylase
VIIEGDCCEVMAGMPESSFDAIVTDPPYGLEFMGKTWDRLSQAWHEDWAREAYRALKPGGHMLAFGGTRTFHRLTCAIEDAGFEIRDCLSYLYGSGFPKSLDVSKAIDKATGAEREVVGVKSYPREGTTPVTRKATTIMGGERDATVAQDTNLVTAPATDAARQWAGFGTALKPAWEPIILARKPLSESSVAANVLKHGTGAINVDGCRIGRVDGDRTEYGLENGAAAGIGYHGLDGRTPYNGTSGRWPANVCLDEESATLLDEQSGESTSPKPYVRGAVRKTSLFGISDGDAGLNYGDTGGASRFFYTAKASTSERNERVRQNGSTNNHPTVKPVDLMRWLCRLITPPGGTILDPFVGSGTTLVAAMLEGFQATGIEQSPEYVKIAQHRIDGVQLGGLLAV